MNRPAREKAPCFQHTCTRHFVKYVYLLGSFSILISSALFTTYLFAYPFRSNVCNGLQGAGTLEQSVTYQDHGGIEQRCLNQVEARGYKSTNDLVLGGLLPEKWTHKHTYPNRCIEKAKTSVKADRLACAAVGDPDQGGTAADLNDATACNAVKLAADAAEQACTFVPSNTRYELCRWNSKIEECVEAEPDQAGCDSELDENGRRKFKWGTDGKCEALKSPEICRQTGFKGANTPDKQEDLAIQGAAAEAAAIVLLVATSLGVLQTLNYHWHILTGCCPGATPLCDTFGNPCKCSDDCSIDIGSCLCGCLTGCMNQPGGCCEHCIAKENKLDGDDAFKVPHEAATIFLSFFVHNVLITVFGIYGKIARDHVEDQCFAVTDLKGCLATADLTKATKEYACVYKLPGEANVTAKSYIGSLPEGSSNYVTGGIHNDNLSDAKDAMEQRGRLYDVALVFWWINTICFGLQLIHYLCAKSGSVDMELVAVRSGRDCNCCSDISTDDQNNIPAANTGYQQVLQAPQTLPVNEKGNFKVQLRGNF